MTPAAPERLKTLRNGLLKLHLKVLESEKGAYERDVQRIATTGVPAAIASSTGRPKPS